MQLGVNFEPNQNAAFGFDRGGIAALRPRLVRHVLFDASEVLAWIESAQRRRLKVLWSIPVESIGLSSALLCLRYIGSHGLDVTAGLELGHAPWFVKHAPRTFCHALEHLCDMAAYMTEPADQTVAGLRFAFSKEARPLIVGVGFDGSRESAAWLEAFNRHARSDRWHFKPRCTALAVHAVSPGRPWRTWMFGGLAVNMRNRYGWPLAITRVGWQVGEVLTTVASWREAWREREWERPRILDYPRRGAWLQAAYHEARRLECTHFVLEADRSRPGVNHWGAYDPQSSRPDPIWHRLTWQHAHTPAHLEAAPSSSAVQ